MQLDFVILPDDGMLEARELDRVYCIFQMKDKCDATVNGEPLFSGSIYECLNSCNSHAHDILNRKKLDVDKELSGCVFEKVDELVFKDHNDEGAAVANRRFRSIDAARSFIQERSKDAIVYVYDLREYHLNGIWYYLNCSIRKK